jgi:hypothetical protein
MEKGGVEPSVLWSMSVSHPNRNLRHNCHRIFIIYCILVTTMSHQWQYVAQMSQNFHHYIPHLCLEKVDGWWCSLKSSWHEDPLWLDDLQSLEDTSLLTRISCYQLWRQQLPSKLFPDGSSAWRAPLPRWRLCLGGHSAQTGALPWWPLCPNGSSALTATLPKQELCLDGHSAMMDFGHCHYAWAVYTHLGMEKVGDAWSVCHSMSVHHTIGILQHECRRFTIIDQK